MRTATPWFKKVRGSYLPNSWQGWLTYLPYSAYIISAFVFVMVRQYDLWQALFTVIPNWIAALVVMNWVASRTA